MNKKIDKEKQIQIIWGAIISVEAEYLRKEHRKPCLQELCEGLTKYIEVKKIPQFSFNPGDWFSVL